MGSEREYMVGETIRGRRECGVSRGGVWGRRGSVEEGRGCLGEEGTGEDGSGGGDGVGVGE